MSFAEQLRQIADTIEDAEATRDSAIARLRELASVHEPPNEQAGAVQDGRTPGDQPGDVGSTPASRSNIEAASGQVACPECGKEVKAADLGVHRRWAHGLSRAGQKTKRRETARNGRGAPPPATAAAQPVIRKGSESYLCSRCPEQFRTSEALVAHMQKGHPPGGTARPVGEQPVMDFGAKGFGE